MGKGSIGPADVEPRYCVEIVNVCCAPEVGEETTPSVTLYFGSAIFEILTMDPEFGAFSPGLSV